MVPMDGTSVFSADTLLSKRVQEMVLNGEKPLPAYLCRGSEVIDHEYASSPTSSSVLPIIDFTLLLSSAVQRNKQDDELQKLRSALSSWGCFQAIGHGISTSFLDKVRRVGREFFEQPMEEKKKHSKGVEEFEGYGADPVPEEGQFLDWSDRLFLEVYPEDRRKLKYWPENPPSFRDVVEEYTEKIKKFTGVVSKVMAKSLSLEENCFLDKFGERGTLEIRFNYYSCCEMPDLVLGLKPHSDSSGFTVILQDEVEGLQVENDEKWVTVPTIPHALLVLIGDQMEIMSNGIFKGPVHRVLTNAERKRVSVAMFYTPEANREIGPEESLIKEETPKLFKNVKDYNTIFFEHYQRGTRAIHVVKV